jgi:sugar lactone lactonase YvrE
VDILAGRIYHWDLSTGSVTHFDVGEPVGAVALVAGGGLVAALHRGFGLITGRDVKPIGPEIVPEGRRMNDGKCDPLGRFWAGTLADDGRPGGGTLYRLGHDGDVTVVIDRVTISNGIDWSPDGRKMYYADSATHRIDVFDFDPESGNIGGGVPFVSVSPPGLPDGLTVDADGCVWLAVFGSSEVLRFSPDGRLDRRVRMPVTHPTSVVFGGPDLTTLYVTSSRHRLPSQERTAQPHAGHVFALATGVDGLPARRYVTSTAALQPDGR